MSKRCMQATDTDGVGGGGGGGDTKRTAGSLLSEADMTELAAITDSLIDCYFCKYMHLNVPSDWNPELGTTDFIVLFNDDVEAGTATPEIGNCHVVACCTACQDELMECEECGRSFKHGDHVRDCNTCNDEETYAHANCVECCADCGLFFPNDTMIEPHDAGSEYYCQSCVEPCDLCGCALNDLLDDERVTRNGGNYSKVCYFYIRRTRSRQKRIES